VSVAFTLHFFVPTTGVYVALNTGMTYTHNSFQVHHPQ